MAFSFYQSLKTLPTDLDEAVTLYRLTRWQRFTRLEVPAATIGLIWNAMLSFGGGWFFLAASEAISVLNQQYTLPGIGSYVAAAVSAQDLGALGLSLLTMAVVILLIDQLFWRPLVAWGDKFKLEKRASAEPPRSWLYDLLRTSRIPGMIEKILAPAGEALEVGLVRLFPARPRSAAADLEARSTWTDRILSGALVLLVVALLAGALKFVLGEVGLDEVGRAVLMGLATFGRVVVRLVLSANPGRVRGEFPVHLPRPRNRNGADFKALVDHLYAIMTNPEMEVAPFAVPAAEPSGWRFPPLPHARAGGISGFLELLVEQGGKADIPQLAEQLGQDIDDLLPIMDAAVLLGFADVAQGDVTVIETGRLFAEADILTSKQVFRKQVLDHAPLVVMIYRTLRKKPTMLCRPIISWTFSTSTIPNRKRKSSSRRRSIGDATRNCLNSMRMRVDCTCRRVQVKCSVYGPSHRAGAAIPPALLGLSAVLHPRHSLQRTDPGLLHNYASGSIFSVHSSSFLLPGLLPLECFTLNTENRGCSVRFPSLSHN